MSTISSFNSEASSCPAGLHPVEQESRQFVQTALIVSGIASTVFLSSVGVLPAAISTVATYSVLSTLGFAIALIAITKIYETIFSKSSVETDSDYTKELKKLGPIPVIIIGPILEEITFRGIIQGGTDCILKKLLPSISVTLLGSQIPLATAVATVAAGTMFGLVHLSNDHKGAIFQATYCAITGIVCEGMLFNTYGLWASSFAHIINNTIAATPLFCCKSQ